VSVRDTKAPASDEYGSVSVVAAVVIGITLVCSLGVADVAKALVARAHAQAAADAAALAAAQELALADGRDPAEPAAEYATRNGASIVSCDCPAGGSEAIARVTLPVGSLFLLADDRTVTASARAVVDLPSSSSASPSPSA
jgi:secretion/DNA translocation related TadE-like protein